MLTVLKINTIARIATFNDNIRVNVSLLNLNGIKREIEMNLYIKPNLL